MGLPLFFLLKDSAGTSMAAFAMIVVMLPCFLLAKFFLTSYYGATPDFAKLPQKKNAAISKKDYNAS